MKWVVVVVVLLFVTFGLATVTSPGSCVEWYSGYEYTIEWNSESFGSQVSIELYNGAILVEEIVSSVANTGSYSWEVPYYQSYFFNCQMTITIRTAGSSSSTAESSSTFNLYNPLVWGNGNIEMPFFAGDTFFKARWSGIIVPTYELTYREYNKPSTEKTLRLASDRRENEDHDEKVISNLKLGKSYEYRMRYYPTSNQNPSEWTEWVLVDLYERLDCTEELLSVFFSLEVYDSLRTGQVKYPGFCGNWKTIIGWANSTQFSAIYADSHSKRAIVAWRGTQPILEDFYLNFQLPAPCTDFIEIEDSKCEFHSGYGSEYIKNDYEEFLDIIENLIEDDYGPFIITGHSQGAGIGLIAALDYANIFGDDIQLSVHTLGTPQAGNQFFNTDLLNAVSTVVRYAQYDELGNPDEVTLLVANLYPDSGYTTLPSTEVKYECPNIPLCRSPADGIPPFYCHCMLGYYDNAARRNEIADTTATVSSPSSNTSPGFRLLPFQLLLTLVVLVQLF